MTSRNWCFTDNNPEDRELLCLKDSELVKMAIWQIEEGTNGTEHIQGYLELVQPQRISALKKLLPRAHLEKRKGSRSQAVLYCCKEEGRISGPFSLGLKCSLEDYLKRITEGKKLTSKAIELEEIRDKLSQGEDFLQIADEHFAVWVRHWKAFQTYIILKSKPRSWKTNVTVIIGPTGTGKSKWAMDTYPDAYWKQRGTWWCGYNGHEHVVIDEFYGWLPWDTLLRICDRYPMLLETKGGQVSFVGKNIVITSNKHPHLWYTNDMFDAFIRRVDNWIFMEKLGDIEMYEDYEELKKKLIY